MYEIIVDTEHIIDMQYEQPEQLASMYVICSIILYLESKGIHKYVNTDIPKKKYLFLEWKDGRLSGSQDLKSFNIYYTMETELDENNNPYQIMHVTNIKGRFPDCATTNKYLGDLIKEMNIEYYKENNNGKL